MNQHKPHRFDKFARRVAGTMLEAIRTTLVVFTPPDKDRWPAEKLMGYLKSAEEMARGMLREIAAKITILPGKARERAGQAPVPPEPSPECAPYFRLGVKNLSRASGEHKQGAGADAPSQAKPGEETALSITDKTNFGALCPCSDRFEEIDPRSISNLSRRLAALQDVLAHPGKHAARMARALYRAAHEVGGRLIAKSPDDMLLDRVNAAIAEHIRGDVREAARLHKLVLEPG